MTAPGGLVYRMSEQPLDQLLEAAIHEFQERYRQRGLELTRTIEGDGPWCLSGDPDRLAQMLRNLLANSLAHTDRGGKVVVTLGRDSGPPGSAREDDHLYLNIDDTEPGVAEASLSKLFERFYREEASRSRDTGGAGLGLAIARNIVLAHGGEIQAVHADLGGLGLRIRFPVARKDGP